MTNRIALFTPSLGGGGAERVMLHLAHGFASRGYAVDMVTATARVDYQMEFPPGMHWVNLGAAGALASLPRLTAYLRRERPCVLLATQSHANIVALWANRFAGKRSRLVIREANMVTSPAKRWRAIFLPLLSRWFYPWADGIVAVSNGVADDMSINLGIPRARIVTIYNSVMMQELMEMAGQTPDHPWFREGAMPVIVSAGRLTRQKDFATLIRAFSILRKRKEARLMILGEGELRGELERLVGELGLSGDVQLPGFSPNPYACMSRAAVYVLSSAWEGMPNSLIEALALGTPLVAADCRSGPREILEEGRYGKLVPVGDAEAMAAAILEVLDGMCGAKPGAEALFRFDPDYCVDQYIKILGCD